MHVTELYRRIRLHTSGNPDTRTEMRARILHPGQIFTTVDREGRISLWTVTPNGFPAHLPDPS